MKATQFNTLNMFLGVVGVLEANRELYSDIPMVVTTADEFISVVDQINAIGNDSDVDQSGVISEKSKMKDYLANRTRFLGGTAKALAFDQDDRKMSAALSYSYSEIRYAKDAEALQIAQSVLSVIESHADELVEYGITSEVLDEYRQTVDNYQDLVEDSVEIKAIGVAETKQLAYLIGYGGDLLREKIDSFFFKFKIEKPEFWDSYQKARMIIDL